MLEFFQHEDELMCHDERAKPCGVAKRGELFLDDFSQSHDGCQQSVLICFLLVDKHHGRIASISYFQNLL